MIAPQDLVNIHQYCFALPKKCVVSISHRMTWEVNERGAELKARILAGKILNLAIIDDASPHTESAPQNPQIPEQIDSVKTLSRVSTEFELEFITGGRNSGRCLQWNFETEWLFGVNKAFQKLDASISIFVALNVLMRFATKITLIRNFQQNTYILSSFLL